MFAAVTISNVQCASTYLAVHALGTSTVLSIVIGGLKDIGLGVLKELNRKSPLVSRVR